MQIGSIAGGVTSLQAPSRRAPSSAIALRDDGWVALIDVRAADERRLEWAWSTKGSAGREPAAAVGWMTAEVPLVVTAEGGLFTLDRSRRKGGQLAVVGEQEYARSAAPLHLGLITRQQCPVAGPPFAVTADETGASWWGLTADREPVFDGFYAWPRGDADAPLPGVVLPWVNAGGFVKLVDGNDRLRVVVATRPPVGSVLQVRHAGDAPVPPGGYRVIGAFPAERGVGVDVAVVASDRLMAVRVRADRPAETVYTPRPVDPGWQLTSADLRNNVYLVSSAGPGGGAVEVLDLGTGRPRWRFDLDLGVQDVVLLHDGRRTRAVAVDDGGGVHLWTVDRDAPGGPAAGSTPPSAPAAGVALRGIDLE